MPTMAQDARHMLETVILPFWKALRDEENGGYYGYMDFDLRLDRKAEKGCILNSRILWTFSEAAMLLGDSSLRSYADHAYRFLADRCLDRARGGVCWSLTWDGKPLDTTKHTYNQAFAVYALAAYYRLTGDPQVLALARELLSVIETRCTDDEGYLEAFTADWQPESNEKLSENGVMAARTMNTLLHVFEGYSGLYQAAEDPAARAAMERILDLYLTKVYDPAARRQRVFFDPHYNSILDLTSYGHDIESSWLMDWGCALLADPALLKKVSAVNSALAESTLAAAYSRHSLAEECDRGRVSTWRVWWVQAEAVLGFLHQAEKTGEAKYLDAARDIYGFIRQRLCDPRPGGEWYWRVDETGAPDPSKPVVEPWKCPYHSGRMCMEIIRRYPYAEL